MSELIQKNDSAATIRWKLMASVSAVVLMASSPSMAEDGSGHPLFWIELGATGDSITGIDSRFTPDFIVQSPTPTPYGNGNSPLELQKPPRFTFGGEATLTFQPEDSNWKFSAGIKYGRSNNKRDTHGQTNATIKFPNPAYEHIAALYPSYLPYYPSIIPTYTKYAPKFAETTVRQSERHMVIDFQAGKDVGLGMFGRGGTGTLSGGVRMARFEYRSNVLVHARPNADFYSTTFPNPWGGGPHASYVIYSPHWASYYLRASAERSFRGIGPSLAWKASVPLAGNTQKGELELDWGINGSVLFGKQKAKVSHHTSERYFKNKYTYNHTAPGGTHYTDHNKLIYDLPGGRDQSHSVTVPNLGATIGLSYRIENTKVSIGYRADYFFSAMDNGIDTAKKKTLGFNGVYASVSVGLGD